MRINFSMILGVLILSSVHVLAQTQEEPANKPFNEEQRVQAREELRKLGEVFGLQQQTPTTPAEPQKPTSVAEVADKALDMVGNAVAQISATVQNVAPEIWRIMIRQQYANAVGYLIRPVGIILVLFVFRTQVNKMWEPKSDDGEITKLVFVQAIPILVMLLFAILLALGATNAAQILINPEYYAVRDLVQILLNSTR